MKSKLIFFLVILVFTSCENGKTSDKKYFNSRSNYTEYKNELKKITEIEKKFSKVKLSIKDTLYNFDNNQFIKLSDILNESGLLIFRFRDLNCMVCVDSVFSIMNEMKIDHKKTVIFCDGITNPRGLELIKNKHKFYGKIYSIQNLIFNKIDQSGYPYLFFLKNDGTIVNLHLPNKQDYKKTKMYLQKISNKFLQ